ncbi:hypothetical protein EYF80_058004 [Liparis tanakae]|uniref:Uncharacterized protein n=1 Tax=Liparis tanakae TaxID=230148 RepID=A0A4Z2ESE6_9TELE|nr:hypothetical protein EYF80_058004 [Liparis tanakae]
MSEDYGFVTHMFAEMNAFPSLFPLRRPTTHEMNVSVFSDVIPQGTIMEEMDFEQRRELRRQKREEMRLEAER